MTQTEGSGLPSALRDTDFAPTRAQHKWILSLISTPDADPFSNICDLHFIQCWIAPTNLKYSPLSRRQATIPDYQRVQTWKHKHEKQTSYFHYLKTFPSAQTAMSTQLECPTYLVTYVRTYAGLACRNANARSPSSFLSTDVSLPRHS